MEAIPLLAYVLQRMPPRHISLESLYAFERLLKAVVRKEVLVKQFYQHLYLNFRLWIYTEWGVQKVRLILRHFCGLVVYFGVIGSSRLTLCPRPQSFLHSLVAHTSANATVFIKQLGGVFPFLDALRYAYWLDVPADDSADGAWRHPITREALAQRPSGPQILEARAILLTAVEVLVSAAPEEIQVRISRFG